MCLVNGWAIREEGNGSSGMKQRSVFVRELFFRPLQTHCLSFPNNLNKSLTGILLMQSDVSLMLTWSTLFLIFWDVCLCNLICIVDVEIGKCFQSEREATSPVLYVGVMVNKLGLLDNQGNCKWKISIWIVWRRAVYAGCRKGNKKAGLHVLS